MRHGNLVGRERAAAEGAQVYVDDFVLAAAEMTRESRGGLQLAHMPLAIAEGECVERKSLFRGQCQRGRRIQTARE